MPVLSRFYGITIKMYFQQREHNPPHIHAFYNGEYMASINIQTLETMEGDLPVRATALVREWVSLHQSELLEIWNTQRFVDLSPLD